MDKEELWEEAKGILLSESVQGDLKGVFLNLIKPIGMVNNSVVFMAQSNEVEEWIVENCIDEMKEALTRTAEHPMTVEIVSTSKPQEGRSSADKAQNARQQPETPFAAPNTSQPIQKEPDFARENVSPSDIQRGKSYQTSAQTTQPRKTFEQDSTRNQALFSKCTFKTFVCGRSNEFARGAALAVAEEPGTAYNPLFIYGSSGLGKTHLLVAIANYVSENLPYMRTLYVSANDFLNDYVSATQKNQWSVFNEKYHAVDVLLLDDVQYLENKDETINQLFNIFNEMTSRNKQVVLSADRAPRDINMDERMRSRFSSGLLADIKPPDYETRLAILKNYYGRMKDDRNLNVIIPDDVLEYLAETSTSNIREIEGAVTRLISNMSLLKKDHITVEETKELLKDFFPSRESKKIEISTIMSEVEHYFNVSHEDMISTKRHKGITTPRHIAIYLSRYLTEESLEAIGKKFGGRDHTTIMHSVSKIEQEQKKNRALFDQIEQLTVKIKERS